MLNLFGTKYTKHAMTVGGGVVGAYLAKNGMENCAKTTGEIRLLEQKNQHAHELAQIALEHEKTLIKMQEEHKLRLMELVEKKRLDALVPETPSTIIQNNSIFSPTESSWFDIFDQFMRQFVDVTVGSGNEIYIVLALWFFYLFSIINIKVIYSFLKQNEVFKEYPKLQNLFLWGKQINIVGFVIISIVLIYLSYLDFFVYPELLQRAKDAERLGEMTEMFLKHQEHYTSMFRVGELSNNLLNTKIEVLTSKLETVINKIDCVEQENKDLREQLKLFNNNK